MKDKKPTVSTGCANSLSCQHMDLGKAQKAGKPGTICFCRKQNDFAARRDNCPDYHPLGCASGICSYANHKKGSGCYCSYYGKTVTPRESCPDYLDFFESPEGQTILGN